MYDPSFLASLFQRGKGERKPVENSKLYHYYCHLRDSLSPLIRTRRPQLLLQTHNILLHNGVLTPQCLLRLFPPNQEERNSKVSCTMWSRMFIWTAVRMMQWMAAAWFYVHALGSRTCGESAPVRSMYLFFSMLWSIDLCLPSSLRRFPYIPSATACSFSQASITVLITETLVGYYVSAYI